MRPLHVLVVDDYPAAVDLLSHSLGRHGYAVQTAVNGAEALALFEASRPGAVVLDLRMPIMDGTAVFAEMHRIGPDVPVMIVTANLDEGLAQRLLQRGAFDYSPSSWARRPGGPGRRPLRIATGRRRPPPRP